jgi:GT2 family glycosyltransferase
MTAVFKPQLLEMSAAPQATLAWSHDRTFSGHVFDAADPGRSFVVELLVDGHPVACQRAADHVASLAEKGIGDGRYGFSFSLTEPTLAEAEWVEARIANSGTAVGAPISLRTGAGRGIDQVSPGAVRWLGGLRFSGWIGEDDTVVDILVDGERVRQARATGWSHVGNAEDARAVRALDLHLPERFADGAAHRLAAMTPQGEHLEGSPLPFVAFADGLKQTIAGSGTDHGDSLRGELFDRLVPMSIPFAQYQPWRERLPARGAAGSPLQAGVVIVGPGSVDDTVASLNAQGHTGWVAAALPEACDVAGFDIASAQEFLDGEGAGVDFVLFTVSGALLGANALAVIADVFDRHPEAIAVYGDVDIAAGDGSLWPLAFPAFDYERMLEQGYCAHVFALRCAAAVRALEAGAANLYRVFNSVLDQGPEAADRIFHLPGALASLPPIDLAAAGDALAEATGAHLRCCGVDAEVTPEESVTLPAVRVVRAVAAASVSIIIPTRNRRDLLAACMASIAPAARRRRCEVIIVDNDSSDPATLDYLASIDGSAARVLRIKGPFNFARLNNLAAEAARGEFLCLLNNDVQARDDHWLDEMLGRAAAPDVGAVGAALIWPSGVVQHGGVVLGPNFAATHAFNDRIDGDAGYGDLLRVAHECSAVTAACLVTRRQDYLALGGMDAYRFPVNFNDVDYCLRLRAAGKRVVFTPHARLLHLESASRGTDRQADRRARFERELRNLRAKWADVLAADPFYSPALALDAVPFSALAWPQRSMAPRTSAPPVATVVPPGF